MNYPVSEKKCKGCSACKLVEKDIDSSWLPEERQYYQCIAMAEDMCRETEEIGWYEVCLVVPGTDGDAENGPCEPAWWKDMVRASNESEAIKIANEKITEDWKSPKVDEAGVEIGPSDEDLGSECPVCEWARKATDEEYQAWKAERERLEKERADLPFA